MTAHKTIKERLQYELDLLLILLPTYLADEERARLKFEKTKNATDGNLWVKSSYELRMRHDRIEFITRILRDYSE